MASPVKYWLLCLIAANMDMIIEIIAGNAKNTMIRQIDAISNDIYQTISYESIRISNGIDIIATVLV
jgi:hypothetical protein